LLDSAALAGIYGALPFAAPEMLQQKEYGAKVDVWSCGIIAYWLLFGQLPHVISCGQDWQLKVLAPTTKAIFEGRVQMSCKRQPSRDAREFVASLLNIDPTLRPDATQAFCDLEMYLGDHDEFEARLSPLDEALDCKNIFDNYSPSVVAMECRAGMNLRMALKSTLLSLKQMRMNAC